MTVFSGKGVYGAIAIGKLSIFKKNDTTINMNWTRKPVCCLWTECCSQQRIIR